MDGLNKIWKEYGQNEHDLIVLQTCNDNFGLSSYVNTQGVLHPSVESNNGGKYFGEQFFTNGAIDYNGYIFLIYPDKSFKGEFSHNYSAWLEDANVSKGETAIKSSLSFGKNMVNIKCIRKEKLIIDVKKAGKYSVDLFMVNGKKINLENEKNFSEGIHKINLFQLNISKNAIIISIKNDKFEINRSTVIY